MTHDFAYHRAVAPMMWVLVAIAVVELAVVHLLVSLWSRPAALVLSAASAAGVVWLVAAIAGFRRRPVRIADGRLLWRVGRLRCVEVPLARVAGLRAAWDAAAVKDRSVLNLALIAYPNVVVDLTEPIVTRRGRQVHALAHRLDDPAAFAAALSRLSPGNG